MSHTLTLRARCPVVAEAAASVLRSSHPVLKQAPSDLLELIGDYTQDTQHIAVLQPANTAQPTVAEWEEYGTGVCRRFQRWLWPVPIGVHTRCELLPLALVDIRIRPHVYSGAQYGVDHTVDDGRWIWDDGNPKWIEDTRKDTVWCDVGPLSLLETRYDAHSDERLQFYAGLQYPREDVEPVMRNARIDADHVLYMTWICDGDGTSASISKQISKQDDSSTKHYIDPTSRITPHSVEIPTQELVDLALKNIDPLEKARILEVARQNLASRTIPHDRVRLVHPHISSFETALSHVYIPMEVHCVRTTTRSKEPIGFVSLVDTARQADLRRISCVRLGVTIFSIAFALLVVYYTIRGRCSTPFTVMSVLSGLAVDENGHLFTLIRIVASAAMLATPVVLFAVGACGIMKLASGWAWFRLHSTRKQNRLRVLSQGAQTATTTQPTSR